MNRTALHTQVQPTQFLTPLMAIAVSSILMASLRNFYFPYFGGAILSFGGGLLLILGLAAQSALTLDVRYPPRALFLTLSLFTVAILHIAVVRDAEALRGGMGLTLGATCFLAASCLFSQRWNSLAVALKIVLAVHIFALTIQVLFYFVFGHYIDYVAISSDSSRWLSSKAFTIFGEKIPRFTGLFSEPGTYSGTIGAVAATKYFIDKKLDVVFVLSVISLFLSAALTGMVMGCLLILAALFELIKTRRNLRVPFAVLVLVFAVVAGAVLYERLLARPYSNLGEDVAVVHLLWLVSPEGLTVMGHHVDALPDLITHDYLGLWMSMYIRFGLTGLIVLGLCVAIQFRQNFILTCIILIAKLQATFPLSFILLGIVWGYSHYVREISHSSLTKFPR